MTKENDKEPYSVSYTKAGLLNKSRKGSGAESRSKPDEPEAADSPEGMPTVSKERSTVREDDRPVH